jgi:hypothetical protein
VGTSIIQAHHESLPARIFRYLAFPANGYGLSSVLAAMFVENNSGDFFISTKLMHGGALVDGVLSSQNDGSFDAYDNTGARTTCLLQKVSYHWTPIRDMVLFGGSMVIMQWQRLLPAVMETAKSSQVSYDKKLQEEFYKWSRQAVQEWM